MSRHELAPRDSAHKVIVGWDHPMQTFFVQVIDCAKEAAGGRAADHKHIVWRGLRLRELYEVDQVERLVRPYADFSPEIGATLYGDKDEGR